MEQLWVRNILILILLSGEWKVWHICALTQINETHNFKAVTRLLKWCLLWFNWALEIHRETKKLKLSEEYCCPVKSSSPIYIVCLLSNICLSLVIVIYLHFRKTGLSLTLSYLIQRILLIISVFFQVVDHLMRESHFLKLYSWTSYPYIMSYWLD